MNYPEPTWGLSVYMEADNSTYLRSPVVEFRRFSDFLVAILQQLFSDPNTIKNPALRECIYSKTNSLRKILICRSGSVDVTKTNESPAIIVSRGEYSTDFLGWFPNQLSVAVGTTSVGGAQSSIMHCEYRVTCFSRTSSEAAEALHDEVVWHLGSLSSIIRQETGMWSFKPMRGTAVQLAKADQLQVPPGSFFTQAVLMADFNNTVSMNVEEPW